MISNQIVTISREYGSGGRIVGKELAKAMDVPYYDREILNKVAEESGFSRELMEEDERKAGKGFFYNLSMAFGSGSSGDYTSINEKFFLAQFDYVQKMAKEEKSFVIVGRCADYILREFNNVTNVYIYGDTEDKIKRAVEKYGQTEEEAEEIMKSADKARANYYHYHTGRKWGDPHNYNLCIGSGRVREEKIANIILEYIENREA